ncbi:MAG TPA: FixH family protein [Flavobacteriaceae bacterium]|nr:FixH family protein [Flavobacteriaceae bacterium]MCB9213855.1 FixH family protein [Alteromonas sp.]HPF11251.1 FixH family protein [Flavobacteriaceae bacterium]HQU21730.1 FixH family protein [Flavobacteriaceae bacterium]HQU64530.1 FixH family protein [Flavobacteriaceae bacterium]
MKINWGTGLVIGMVAFMGFIMFMVVTMMTDKKYDHDLVTEAYYAEDLVYQTEIDAEEHLKKLSGPITVEKTAAGWLVHFPEEMTHGNPEGTLKLYRPSNKNLDFQLPLEITDGTMLVPKDHLVAGHWKMSIAWNMNGTAFLFKKGMVY